jgi:tetratricopeptide (TPR) repeat protein
MSKRLEMLEKLVQQNPDPFARYALGMEYGKLERWDEALISFEALRAAHPDYLPTYLMAGQLLIQRQRNAEACEWLEAGIALARRTGEVKAASELEAALATARATD